MMWREERNVNNQHWTTWQHWHGARTWITNHDGENDDNDNKDGNNDKDNYNNDDKDKDKQPSW